MLAGADYPRRPLRLREPCDAALRVRAVGRKTGSHEGRREAALFFGGSARLPAMVSTPPRSAASAADVPARAAALILDAFLDYNERFADITRRAKRHFEQRDWRAAQLDALARIDLYDVCVAETLERLELLLDDRVRSRSLWAAMRRAYESQVQGLIDRELTKTFFNTLSRRFFHTLGVDAEIEFVALDLDPTVGIAERVALNRYEVAQDLVGACARLLGDYPFATGYVDPARGGGDRARDRRAHVRERRAAARDRAAAAGVLPRAARVSGRPHRRR